MLYSIFILFVSVYVMRKCSSSFDIAANYLTRDLGEGIKGPTINAIASSLPELLISSMFLFHFKDIKGFSAGYATIIGSSAFNIAMIPVIAFIYIYIKKGKEKVFHINKEIVKQDSFFLLGSIIILSLGFFVGINVYLASMLILFYFSYVYYVIQTRSTDIINNNLEINNTIIPTEDGKFFPSVLSLRLFRIFFKGRVDSFTSIFVLLASVLIIGGSCYLLVLATEDLSHHLGINLFFGAFIIAAIASSIPDTIFSVQDAKNDRFIDSFSNAYGSNIFDICIGIGLPVLVYSFLYGSISMNIPIERIGWLGNYMLSGNLFIWSLLILFSFTIIVSLVYYKFSLKLNSAFVIFFLYILFVIALIIF